MKIINFKKTLSLILISSLLFFTISTITVYAIKKPSLTKASATSETSVTLKWKKVSSISGYEIFQKKSDGKFKKVKTIKNKNTSSLKLTKLSPATKYTYKMRTFKTSKKKTTYSSFSNTKSATTKPNAPVITNAVIKGSVTTLNWKKVVGAKGYIIYKKTNTANTKIKTVSSSVTSTTLNAKLNDILTIRAYLTVDKKNIYSKYSKEIVVVKEKTQSTVSNNNYATKEDLTKHINELKTLLANNYIDEEKLETSLNGLKDLFANSYVTKEDLQEYLDKLTPSLSAYEYVDITNTLTKEKCYYGYWDGSKVDFSRAESCYISVNPGDKFKVTGYTLYNVALALFYDADGKIIDNTTYLNPDGKSYNNETITIPENCYYVAFGSFTDAVPNVFLNVKKYQQTNTTAPNAASKSILYEKSMYADGDSIAAGAQQYSYVDFITDENIMTTNKMAAGGTTLAVRSGRSDSICERILSMDTTKEYDYILLQGGFNDLFVKMPLGTITNYRDYSGNYDKTTVIGATETICHFLVNNYYDSKKLFVLGHKSFGFWEEQVEYWDAIKSVLEKWGIPYVDLSKESNLCKRTSVDSVADKYFVNGDGVHPTKEAYEIFYVPLIKAKLEDL